MLLGTTYTRWPWDVSMLPCSSVPYAQRPFVVSLRTAFCSYSFDGGGTLLTPGTLRCHALCTLLPRPSSPSHPVAFNYMGNTEARTVYVLPPALAAPCKWDFNTDMPSNQMYFITSTATNVSRALRRALLPAPPPLAPSTVGPFR